MAGQGSEMPLLVTYLDLTRYVVSSQCVTDSENANTLRFMRGKPWTSISGASV